MTCITIKNKEELLNRLAKDGMDNVAGMLEKVGVMDSRQEDSILDLKLDESLTLSDIILSKSWDNLNLTSENATNVGSKLQKTLALDSNPISESNGNITYSEAFQSIQNKTNELVHREYLKTNTSVEESTDFMITTPIENREKERIRKNGEELRALRDRRRGILSLLSTNPEIKRTLERDLKAINSRVNSLESSIANSKVFLEDLIASPGIHQVFIKAKEDLDLLLSMVNDKAELTPEKIEFIEYTANLWRSITDASSKANVLQLTDELKDEDILRQLAGYNREFGGVLATVAGLKREKGIELTNSRTKIEVDAKTLYDDAKKDSNIFAMNLRGLQRSSNPLLQSIAALINKTNNLVLSTFKSREKRIDMLYSKIRDGVGTNFNIFIAKDKNGRDVGSLVDRFSHDFWVDLRDAMSSGRRAGREWLTNNTLAINFALLYDDESDIVPSEFLMNKATQEQKDTYKKQLLEMLGQDGYDEYKDLADEYVAQYFVDRDAQYNALIATTGMISDKKLRQFELWNNYESPFIQSKHAITGVEKDSKGNFIPKHRQLQIRVPRRVHKKTGKRLDYYDKNFAKIEGNKELLEFHKMAKHILKDAQINFNFNGLLHANALPYLQKTALNQIMTKGSSITRSAQTLLEAGRDVLDTKPKDKKVVLDSQGNVVKDINKGVVTIESVAREIFEYKILDYKSKNKGAEPDATTVKKLQADALAEAGANQDLDLPKLLKVLSLNSIAFSQKMMVKAQVEMLTSLFKDTNKTEKQEDLRNALIWLENTLDSDFYGESTRKVRKVLGKSISAENKKKLKLLRDEILRIQNNPKLEDEEKQEEIDVINDKMDGLYKTVYLSELIRQYLGYTRVLGIGWNLVSSLTNALFGQVGNFQRALQADEFDTKDLRDSLRRVFITDIDKVEAIAGKISLVGDVTYSFLKPTEEERGTNKFAKFAKYSSPYFLQTFSEEFNQSPIMVAMLRKVKVKNLEGDEKSFYDVIDEKGNVDKTYLNENGIGGEELLSEVTLNIRRVVQETHGDYNSTFLANNEEWKQSLLMFKRWLPEMFYRRFGDSGVDYISGTNTTGIYIETINVLKEAITDHSIGDLLNKKSIKEINDGLTTEQKGKLRAALIGDFGIYFVMVMLSKMISDMLCDEPKCKEGNIATVFTLNIMTRLNTEIGTFFSPASWIDMLANPVSSSRTLKDVAYFFAAFPAYFQPNKKSSYYTSGRHKGMNKAVVKTGKVTPFFGQLMRLYNYADETTYEASLGSLWGTWFDDDDMPDLNP